VPAIRCGTIAVGKQFTRRLLPRRVGSREAHRRHPWLVARARVDPLDGGVGFDLRAIPSGAGICKRYFFHMPVFDDDKRGDVIAVESIEFERGRRTDAGLIIRYKYTA